MSLDHPEPHFPERRDWAAREARDRLAALLDIPPGELRVISAEQADAMARSISEWREHHAGG